MFLKILNVFFLLVIIISHGYMIFGLFRTIFESTKMIRDNRNIKYLAKTWKLILGHKSVCIYSVLFFLYVLIGVKIAKESSLLHPTNKDVALAMLPAMIHIFVLRYIFGMSIAMNVRNVACGQRKHIGGSILISLFYYYPVYLWKRFRAYDILRDDAVSFQIKAICYVLERGKYESSIEKAKILKERFYLFGIQQVFDVPLFLYICVMMGFGPDLFVIWNYHNVLAIILKCCIVVIIGCSMFIETLVIIYICQLYLWNQKWEETYSEVLLQGKSAPNIKTIEFPELINRQCSF